jgi:hypothetical protein
VFFVEFAVEFVDLLSRLFKSPFSGSGNPVNPAPATFDAIELRTQETGTFQPMQKRVKRAGTDAVAMVFQFLHHGEAEDGLVRCVKQHMDADEAIEEFALLIGHEDNYNSRLAAA